MDVSNDPPCGQIEPSEACATSLVGALKDNLGSSAIPVPGQPVKAEIIHNLATTIDTNIRVVSEQVTETRSLEWTRNRFAPQLHKLPEEVLSTIFMNVVFNFDHSGIPDSTLMEQDIYTIYRRLYRLLGVCSTWRGLIMTRGVFWSTIPMVTNLFTGELGPFGLSLKRAGGSNLHLVAVADAESPDISKELIEILAEYAPRFYAINLSIGNHQVLVDAIHKLLEKYETGSLTKLSIRSLNDSGNLSWFPSDESYILRLGDPHQILFTELAKALATFRVHGVHFYWQTITFSSRLVELWIENITLGWDDAIISFMQAASSASQLQVLKIITVDTLRRRNSTSGTIVVPPRVVFPNLQSLYIRDIYCNTLTTLLRMIAPGSYHFTFFLRETSLQNVDELEHDFDGIEPGQPEFGLADIGELCDALERVPVHTLMLSEHLASGRLTGPTLQILLGAMPNLKTLKLHRWVFDEVMWGSLKRPLSDQTDPRGRFPALESLQLITTTIVTDEGFQEMVASHPLQQVLLGGTITADYPVDMAQNPLDKGNNMVKWLQDNVQDFRLVEDQYCPPEFQPVRWRFTY
ncbi:unnamed protein product [Rhizoctonia solani]|uniref:F-box domain-containing protein n=1 Tax=Rhizoctonia solani TaxID=456999 RepID=A0A8H3CIY9_9AGAM|nr:unnamed protein product [Rhizoctonia solani]